MYQLVLDTSNQYLYVALAKDFRVFTSILQVGNNNHSETLMDVVKKIMSDNSLTTKDLESIIVGRGPGSYTGVRVACTIAKVMAYLENIKLYSFSSLDLLLSKYLDENKQPIAEFYEMVDEYEKKLEYAKENSSLPSNPNYKAISEFVMSVNERTVKGE